MSRRRKKKIATKKMSYKYNKKQHNPKQISKDFTDLDLLDNLTKCKEGCGVGFPKTFDDDVEQLEWLIANLPTLPYVERQYINNLFSNGLTTGDFEGDKVLKSFMYKQNAKGITNYETLQQAVIHAKEYGKCGLRWLSDEDGWILVPHDHYVSITQDDEQYLGFKRTVAYAVSTNEDVAINMTQSIELDKAEFLENGRLISTSKDIVVVLPEDFVNLRNKPINENGESVLLKDKQRLTLLASVYTRLNYDIKYDGPGRIIFWLKDDIFNGGAVDLSSSQLIDNSIASQKSRQEQAINELQELGNKIKYSTSDEVVLASSMFDKNIEHLPRVTKGTEFFDWLNKEGSILAQNFGITPELIGLGDVSGNVSMEKIIDNAMQNNIVPEREKIATQFSYSLSYHLGVEKVFFDKYELQQQIDDSSERFKNSESVQFLMNVKDENGVRDEKCVETAYAILDSMMQKLGAYQPDKSYETSREKYNRIKEDEKKQEDKEKEDKESTSKLKSVLKKMGFE